MLKGCVPWPAEFARRYVEAGLWEGITVAEMVERTARRQPQKSAVVHGDTRITYDELIRSAKTSRERSGKPGTEGPGSRRRSAAELPGVRQPLSRIELHRCHPRDGTAGPPPRRDSPFRPVCRGRRIFRCRPRRLVRLSADGRRDRGGVSIPPARRRGRRARARIRRLTVR